MASTPRGIWFLGVVLALGVVGRAATESVAPEQQRAREILDATGVKGGLIIQVGCGDGKLTAALRASERYVVQGLDADAKSIEAARRHIQASGSTARCRSSNGTGHACPMWTIWPILWWRVPAAECRARKSCACSCRTAWR